MPSKEDVQRLRQEGSDQTVLDYLVTQDAGLQATVDKYKAAMPKMSGLAQAKFATAMLNKHYWKTWNPEKAKDDDFTQQTFNNATRPKQDHWYTGILDAINAPGDTIAGLAHKALGAETEDAQNVGSNVEKLVDNLDTYGGLAGSAFGPLGTFAGTAIGAGLESGIEGLQGKNDQSLTQSVLKPLGEGAIAGALHGVVKGATSFIKGKPAAQVSQELVQPKATAKVVQETVEKNPGLIQKGGILSKGKILPNQQEIRLAETAKTIPGFGKSPDVIKNAQVVKTSLGSESQSLRTALEASDAALPRKESVSTVAKALDQAASDFGDQPGIFKGMSDIWKTVRAKFPGTTSGEWSARIAFDDELEKRFGVKIFEKGTARAVAARAVRESSNGLIDRYASANGVSFAAQLQRLSHMYDILENLATKAGTETLRSGVQKILNTRTARAAIVGGAGVLGAGAVFDATN